MRMDDEIDMDEFKKMKNELIGEKNKIHELLETDSDEKIETFSEMSEMFLELCKALKTKGLELSHETLHWLLDLLLSNQIYDWNKVLFKPSPIYQALHGILNLNNGGLCGTRTHGQELKRLLLYQLS